MRVLVLVVVPGGCQDVPPLPRNPVHIRILPLGLLGAYVRLQDGWGTLLGLVTPDRAGPGKARNDGILAHILWLLQGTFLHQCFPRWELASNLLPSLSHSHPILSHPMYPLMEWCL